MNIVVALDEENRLKEKLKHRTDPEAARIKRSLALPDLSRTEGSPLHEIVERVKAVPAVEGFDDIEIPEIVPAKISFDLFNFPPDHPARSRSDTYYVDDEYILRTHDTVFWYYYLNHPSVKERMARRESLGAVCYGKVYRKDEIDRYHMNVFHQFGAWRLVSDSKETLTADDLKRVLSEIVRELFGADVEFRINEDAFPYTDPSFEVEVKVGDEWIEILGSGMVKKSVLKNVGLEEYNGWAFGFGLERLAIIGMALPDIRLLWSRDPRVVRQLTLGTTYVEVSKYPPATRDISFIVKKKTFVPNDYFDLVRDVGGDMIEEVELIDSYGNDAKLGDGNISYAYRVIYRAIDRTLTGEEVHAAHQALEAATMNAYGATIR